MEVTVEP